jgi:glycerol-3-phosphate dehydrogenase
MAVTIEDVLMRRIGLQFFSWEASIRAAVPTGAILTKELGWSTDAERAAIEQYQNKIRRLMQLAGLSESVSAMAGT